MLTPVELEALLCAHYRGKYPDSSNTDQSPAAKKARGKFVRLGVMEQDGDAFVLNERGRQWLEAICSTPEPKRRTGKMTKSDALRTARNLLEDVERSVIAVANEVPNDEEIDMGDMGTVIRLALKHVAYDVGEVTKIVERGMEA